MKQASFIPRLSPEHGGALRAGMRKTLRPVDPKRPLHVVMRSSLARGHWSLLHPRHKAAVERLTRAIAKKRGVRLYRFANVGNHLHLLVLAPNRRLFTAFLRELPGRIAMLITGAKKGAASKRRFWDFIPYTRIASWGREFRGLELYFVKNLFEGAGLLTGKVKAAGLQVIPNAGWAASARPSR
jgi:REP element-mobilizing transposase RayT